MITFKELEKITNVLALLVQTPSYSNLIAFSQLKKGTPFGVQVCFRIAVYIDLRKPFHVASDREQAILNARLRQFRSTQRQTFQN